MSIRAAFIAIATVLIGLMVGALYITFMVGRNQRAVAIAESNRYRSYQLADQLRQSSDDLTRMARTYVVTGDSRFEEYFQSILAIRDGEAPRPIGYGGAYWDFIVAPGARPRPTGEAVSLETLMRQMNFTAEEFALLQQSHARSDALVAIESEAMAAVKGLFRDAAGGFTRRGPPDLERARELMHGDAYHREKAAIMEPLSEFAIEVEARTRRETELLKTSERRQIWTALALMAVAISLVGAAFVLLQRRVVRPIVDLADAARRVEGGDYGDRVEAIDSGEIGQLGRSFNQMSEAIRRDIDERKQTAEELAGAREAAESANRTKSAFLANMSHELRTPMNAVLGYSEMLIEEMEDEGLDRHVPDLQKIHSAGKHLLALINDVLDLSKIEAGRMDLFVESFDLREILDEIVATIAPLVAKNQNTLVTEFDEGIGRMRADLTKFRQSIFNLLSNATKFTKNGTITLSASREASGAGDRVILEVSDTGIGIPTDKLDQIFDEFSQADQSISRNYGGTGLGLAISRRFCRLMGGEIEVTSDVGVGSRFRITLPMNVDASDTAANAASGKMIGEEAPASAAGATNTPVVLVIDDDADARELLRRTIEADGCVVVTAASGDDGLALAREIAPAVITLDIMMPGNDGWAVLRELKDDPELQKIPVIMASIIHEKGIGFALGAADYVTKPIDRNRLRQLVAEHLGTPETGSVLVVDDDPAAREIVRRTLVPMGCSIVEAENGRVALERVADAPPKMIILDLMMPVMGGIEFLRELRSAKQGHDIPVVVLTAKVIDPDEQRFLTEQADLLIRKESDDLEAALSQIRTAVSRHTGVAAN